MTTVIARRIPSIPVRTASDTWGVICALFSGTSDPARGQLTAVTGLAAMLIAEEYTRKAPIVVTGAGPQLRVYTMHGDDAVGADDDNLSPLNVQLVGNWALSLPAGEIDIEQARRIVAEMSHITVRSLDEPLPKSSVTTAGDVDVDLEALAEL